MSNSDTVPVCDGRRDRQIYYS